MFKHLVFLIDFFLASAWGIKISKRHILNAITSFINLKKRPMSSRFTIHLVDKIIFVWIEVATFSIKDKVMRTLKLII